MVFISMDWFKGKSTGNHRFSHEIWGFPVIFPLNQSIDYTGWWYTYHSEKYDFVSWDYYSQLNGKIKKVPNHQPVIIKRFCFQLCKSGSPSARLCRCCMYRSCNVSQLVVNALRAAILQQELHLAPNCLRPRPMSITGILFEDDVANKRNIR